MSDKSIKNKATSSLLWSGVEQFGSQGISLLITIVIARIISPKDYGLIAMLSIFMALSQVFINCGFSNYLIQNKSRTERDLSTVFYLNVIVGVGCYLILYLCSPLISNFYSQPLLSKILKIYSLILVISSLTLVQRTLLYINFKYKKLSAITIISLIIAGVSSIIMALNGCGVWTLVGYQLIQAFVTSMLIWITTDWHPKWVYSAQIAKKAFAFGSKLLGANILSTGVANLYTLVIGKTFQATELGFYSRGQSLSSVFPSNFANMLQKATYPVLCELQNNPCQLKQMFCNYLTMAAMVCFPLMAWLMSIAKPLVEILLTDKWLPTVPFLQILAIGYMFDPLMRLNTIILSVRGNTSLSLHSEILKKIALVAVLFISLPFGIKWVTIGVIVYSILDLFIVSFFVKKVIKFSIWEEIKLIGPYLLFSIVIWLTTSAIGRFFDIPILWLSMSLIISVVEYILLIRIFMSERYNLLIRSIRKFLSISNG